MQICWQARWRTENDGLIPISYYQQEVTTVHGQR